MLLKMGSRKVMEAPNYVQIDMHMFVGFLFFVFFGGGESMAFIRFSKSLQAIKD